MARLEDLTRGAQVSGILPDNLVTVVDATWHGSNVVELTYKDGAGHLGNELVFREREPSIEIATAGRPWSFDADGAKLRLVSEAYRIRLAHLFDPLLAVHTSIVDPLPHQITAVYDEMLPRQPLRYLLADDPGAGKTIMTGLLIRELLIRGDLSRCLIVCPGNLVEQWQDELYRRFGLDFTIITRETINSSRSGNPYAELNLVISRLDHLSRNEELQAKLDLTDWDLIVCDEAHKMSASYFGGEVTYTKRYRLGELLSHRTRNFLLLTATPHNGKEEDFQLFMRLIDPDRFEGKYRPKDHKTDATDLMRRLVKEQLLKFDGTPLFPERFAYTVNYKLSQHEAELYSEVTDYVRDEFNRVDALQDNKHKGTVGFALMILQRRLASSPEAIHQSLRRRRERLEHRLKEEKLLKRGNDTHIDTLRNLPALTYDDLDDFEDAPDSEIEATEELVVDQATAAHTIAELDAELSILRRLEELARQVRASGRDKKWEELSKLLQDDAHMFDAEGYRRKLVIFSEHRDTLNYLYERITTLLGRPDAVVTIHGGMQREQRLRAQEAFTQDKDVEILLATDAAGEGINLQRAHLMVNYDLPWNPNRIEQRFGRIHRIGQTEVCHLWNLVAEETREGYVYTTLLRKIETEREALGAGVFDVLGKAIDGTELRSLLIEAIRYGDLPEVKAKLTQIVGDRLDREHLRELLDERALARDSLDVSQIQRIRESMERAEVRRLQPHFVASFFMEAFRDLGGNIKEREPGRYEISNVPAAMRNRSRLIGTGAPAFHKYERVTFEKGLISVPGKPLADLVCPGQPLLDSAIDLILERYRGLLKRGAVLVDANDPGDQPRALFYIEHGIQDARTGPNGQRRVVSLRMQFVESTIEPPQDGAGARVTSFHNAGYAPYLDYAPLTGDQRTLLQPHLDSDAWRLASPEEDALSYAIQNLVPEHYDEAQKRKAEMVDKALVEVHERLTKEITYWDNRANQLKLQELAGKINAHLNSGLARQRADALETRLQKRTEELQQERKLSPMPPVIIGGALVVPGGLLAKLSPSPAPEELRITPEQRARIEDLAMKAVCDAEIRLGYQPRDVSARKLGYDIESEVPGTGRLRFIEVKGRIKEGTTVTISKNEIFTAFNKPEDFILAIVQVDGDHALPPRYVRRPFRREPDFGATSVNYALQELLGRSEDPN